LEITRDGHTTREVLRDDSLTACLTHAYRGYAEGGEGAGAGDLGLHVRTVELLDEAKRWAALCPVGGTHPRKEALSHGR
jgi:hypothetical protein